MKVLVAIDSSPFAYQVLKAVGNRLWPKDCEFRIITLVEATPNWDAEQQFLKQAEIILTERIDYLKKQVPHNRIIGEAAVGPAVSMILSAAMSWNADLIVLGSHGDTGVRRSKIGSVAAGVVNEAPCSVEIIKVLKVTSSAEHKGVPTVQPKSTTLTEV